jgi:hypothetical protein
VSCVSSPFSLVREASRSAQPNETRGVRRDDPMGILDIADFVIDQRSVECLFRVTGGKTPTEYMFSELPQIADIGSTGSPQLPETARYRWD